MVHTFVTGPAPASSQQVKRLSPSTPKHHAPHLQALHRRRPLVRVPRQHHLQQVERLWARAGDDFRQRRLSKLREAEAHRGRELEALGPCGLRRRAHHGADLRMRGGHARESMCVCV
eukprot:20335-Chlamydomonas_euryale.AAC.1